MSAVDITLIAGVGGHKIDLDSVCADFTVAIVSCMRMRIEEWKKGSQWHRLGLISGDYYLGSFSEFKSHLKF